MRTRLVVFAGTVYRGGPVRFFFCAIAGSAPMTMIPSNNKKLTARSATVLLLLLIDSLLVWHKIVDLRP
jgi:hypothetical protein